MRIDWNEIPTDPTALFGALADLASADNVEDEVIARLMGEPREQKLPPSATATVVVARSFVLPGGHTSWRPKRVVTTHPNLTSKEH